MRAYERAINAALRPFGAQMSRISSARDRLPLEATDADRRSIDRLRPYTMTSAARLFSLMGATRAVVQDGVPGDFVECGVWRGGSVMAMVSALQSIGVSDRRIWLYDTYQGMTDPTEQDVEIFSGRTARSMLDETPVADGDNIWCVAGVEDVRTNVTSLNYPERMFEFVVGDVSQTLQESAPNKIALLRLDTDWYESTRAELEILFPRLSVGGYCILDDYGHWAGARRAVDEYFGRLGYYPFMHEVDSSGRIFMKTREVEA